MEIAKISPSGIKVKTKHAMIAVKPDGAKEKNIIDCVLLFNKNQSDYIFFETRPLIVDGPGEYEIKGVKFTGLSKKDSLQYFGKIDGIDTVFIQGSAAQKGKEMITECQVAVIDADVELDQSTLATFSANAVVLYGNFAQNTIKKIGKAVSPSTKYVISKDKLPQDMEIVLLA